MGLYNYIFWQNAYEGIWYAIPRDEQQVFFGVNKDNAKNVYKSKKAKYYNLDFAKLLDNNIAKLKVRFPDKFTEEAALNRNLEEERKTLEQ